MNKHVFSFLFLLGTAVLLWVGAGFLGGPWLALCVTVLIAAVFAYGSLELARFRQASASLQQALHAIPEALGDLQSWLERLPAPLQNPVRQRIEGTRGSLPGPALTPYLLGLLVMLGMLGTFLGMVLTLKGAVFALEGTPDLQALRNAFAIPIRGLGLAFGTSVAGVASSALLGLMAALCRRERASCLQLLDSRIATVLRPFSHSYQRQQAYQVLQSQSQVLPQVVDQLQQLVQQMHAMGERTHAQLLARQQHFHSEVGGAYTALAASVQASLRETLAHSAAVASEGLQPVLQTALAGIAAENRALQERVLSATQAQTSQLLQTTQSQVAQLLQESQAGARSLLDSVQQAHTQLQASHNAQQQAQLQQSAAWNEAQARRSEQMAQQLRSELNSLAQAEAARGEAAVARLGELQTALASHLQTLGLALEAPISRLIATASEAPRAAAEVIGQLRAQVSSQVERDNGLLEERGRILQTLNGLLDGIQHASLQQRAVIDQLVDRSAQALEQASNQFSQRVEIQADKLQQIAANVCSSAVDVSSLGEAFGFAVQAFNSSNERLVASLQGIEGALDQSMARSDEQLAYYVAQARELIDLSIGSQKDIVGELRQLAQRQAQLAGEAA